MTVFQFERAITLPRPRTEVFPFFAAPENLETLTPPWIRFRITTPLPIVMETGALIRYRLRLKGLPLSWTSRITAWDPPGRFVDEQVSGPYRLWIHEHTFEERRGETVVRDVVRYAVPGGRLVNALFVKRDLARIFEYRHARLRDRFGEGDPAREAS